MTIVVTAFANCATLSATNTKNQLCTQINGQCLMEAINYIINDITNIPRELILPESRFAEDLGLDELEMTEIFNRCEDDFDVEISDEERVQIETVRDLHDVILPKLYDI